MAGGIMFPPNVQVQDEGITIVDDMTELFRPTLARGLTQRQVYGGPRLKMTRRVMVRQTELGAMFAFLQAMRGKAVAFYTSPNYTRRGSISSTELLSNNTFTNGATGWTAQSSIGLTVIEKAMRVQRNYGGNANYVLYANAAVTTTQYAPYAARAFAYQGRGVPANGLRWADFSISASFGSDDYLGLIDAVHVPLSASTQPGLYDSSASGLVAGDYFTVPWLSYARCGMVDNGGNLLLQSDAFGTTWTPTQATVSSDAVVAPDGTTTADNLVDNGVNAGHFVSQTVTGLPTGALDYSFSVDVKAGAKSWCFLQLTTGGSASSAFFNLSNGAVGTLNTGANWSNLRSFTTARGNSWYRCTLIGYKTSADTSIACAVGAANADNAASYAGASTAAVALWRASHNASPVPCVGAKTTTAYAPFVGQTGNGIQTKGWPASQSGFLLPGDMVQIGDQLVMITAPAVSDAAGLAWLEFGPALTSSPADGAAVVVTQPLGKFVQSSDPQITNRFGQYAEISFDMEQVYT